MDLLEWAVRILMSSKRLLVMLLGCSFSIYVSFMLDHFIRKICESLFSSRFHSSMFLPTCNLFYAFVHNSDSCPRYIRLKVEIENSIEMTFNSMEHMMCIAFNQFSELVQKQNKYNFGVEEQMFEETPLGESCEEVIGEVLLINWS